MQNDDSLQMPFRPLPPPDFQTQISGDFFKFSFQSISLEEALPTCLIGQADGLTSPTRPLLYEAGN
jgi:hypothetical protein